MLNKTYELSDKLFNDDCSTNKLSDYSLVLRSAGGSETLSYSSDYNQMIVNGGDWHAYSPIKVSTSDEWRLEVDITQINQARGVYLALGLVQSSSIYSSFIGYSSNNVWGVYGYGQPNTWIVPQRTVVGHFKLNTWYTFVLECENGMFNYYIYLEDGTLLDSASVSIPTAYQDKEVDLCIFGYPALSSPSVTYRWKNFKVTAL